MAIIRGFVPGRLGSVREIPIEQEYWGIPLGIRNVATTLIDVPATVTEPRGFCWASVARYLGTNLFAHIATANKRQTDKVNR